MGTINYDSDVTADVTLVTTAETILATLTGVSTPRRQQVRLRGWAQITTGANTTAITLRIRRGSAITDLLIGEANPVQLAAAAGSTEDVEIEAADNGVDLAAATYILTAVQTAASANGSSLHAAIHAETSN